MPSATLARSLVFTSVLIASCDKGDDDDDDRDGGGSPFGDDGGGGDEGGGGSTDSDGDGLTDSEEGDLGLDPNTADTDGDGFDDPTEVEAGSDGAGCWSVPEGEGNWPDCEAQAEEDGVEGEGWKVDEVVEPWSGFDQFEAEVDFYQFYGMVVVVEMSAGWCSPCRDAASTAEDFYQEYKVDGVMLMHVMIDDNSYDGYVTDEGFKTEWVEDYGLTFPVMTDDSASGYAAPYYNLYVEGYVEGVPHFAIYDRELRLSATWSGYDENYTKSIVDDLL